MVVRRFQVRYDGSDYDVDYDTDDGFEVFKFQLYSLTFIPPEDQKIYGGEDDKPLEDELDLVSISEKLRLVSIAGDKPESSTISAELQAESLKSDEELARILQAEEEALLFQQYAASEDNGQFERKIRPYVDQVLMYEDLRRQEAARRTVPVEELEEKALVSLAKEGNFKPSKIEQDHAFLLQLLFWFKKSFRWVNAPDCDSCGNKTASQGMGVALPSETLYGASRVELYCCTSCSKITRFPRYNDPIKLVETRRGRCGEWANCFTFYCRALGYESRLVLDFTDHVWTECFSKFLGRWMHLDPCEGFYDRPLLYEKGWNKKLNYLIAFAKDGVYDVTKRYTRKWHEVLSRRVIITEHALAALLFKMTQECRRGFSSQSLSEIEDHDKKERKGLDMRLHSPEDASLSLPGRQSGDEEWRKARLEFVSNSSSNSSSCPIRLCIDEHVTRVYNAFNPIFDQFVKAEFSKPLAIEVLEILKGVFLDLHNSPFKTRRASMSSLLDKAYCERLLPSFDELLNVLSLERTVEVDRKFNLCLAGDPVITSLALPVVRDALGEIINNLNKCESFGKGSLSLPLLKLSRIHSGSVLASGEELPFGIVTSAFDGTRATKWEEPNGATGCWIVYKVSGDMRHELVAYELMSANDAPERDPMDWVVEGSSDGGLSWRILDQQTSQIFEDRFQYRTFMIKSERFCSNAFRFRFLAVRDPQSTSRLQLGSIDLYSRMV